MTITSEDARRNEQKRTAGEPTAVPLLRPGWLVFVAGLDAMTVGLPYMLQWYQGGTEFEVAAYGFGIVVAGLLLVMSSALVALAVSHRAARWTVVALLAAVAVIQVPPIIAWFEFGGTMTDHATGFGPVGALQHVVVILLCAIAGRMVVDAGGEGTRGRSVSIPAS